MAKPILVLYNTGAPTDREFNEMKVQTDLLAKDAEVFVITFYGCEYNKAELLTKGRKTSTLTKKLERLLNGKA